MSAIFRLGLAVAVLFVISGSASVGTAKPTGPAVTHGVVVGDVTTRSAVLWARANRAATLNVVLSGGGHGAIEQVRVRAEDDFTGTTLLTGLRPATSYEYRVWFSLGAPGAGRGPVVTGSFRTPPADHARRRRLAFGGDLAGQNVCRDAVEGFPIATTIRDWGPDVFVGLGDMIYADNACEAIGRYGNAQMPGGFGPAADLPGFWAHWRYNRADAAPQRLLASAATSASGTTTRSSTTSARSTTPAPRRRTPRACTCCRSGSRRSSTTRRSRSPRHAEAAVPLAALGQAPRAPRARHPPVPRRERCARRPARPKTMLGREQLTWLKERLAELRRDLEGHRLERADVHPDRFPADERPRRLGELRPGDGLRAGAARRPPLRVRPRQHGSSWSRPTSTSPRPSATGPSPTGRASSCTSSRPGR